MMCWRSVACLLPWGVGLAFDADRSAWRLDAICGDASAYELHMRHWPMATLGMALGVVAANVATVLRGRMKDALIGALGDGIIMIGVAAATHALGTAINMDVRGMIVLHAAAMTFAMTVTHVYLRRSL
jgi:hypothetical protein